MNQMESVGSDANVNLVVQLDRAPATTPATAIEPIPGGIW